MNILNRERQRQQQPQRNITPNFLRFKSTRSNKAERKKEQPSDQQNRGSDRSSSRASKCSFDVYEKRVLNFSKLRTTNRQQGNSLHTKKKPQQRIMEIVKNKIIRDAESKRSTSNDRNRQSPDPYERENLICMGNTHRNNFMPRKRSSGNLIRIKSKERFSGPKRNEQSLDKEQQRAKLQNQELLNNLMQHQPLPNYYNKIKIKKDEKKLVVQPVRQKKRFFDDPQIQLHGEDNLRNYQQYEELGKGAYGTVRMAYDKENKQKVAIKVYEKWRLDEPNKIKNIEREIAIQSKLSHPTIAQILETIETQTEIYLVMEYGGANSLYKYLLSKPEHRLEERQAKSFFKTILIAISYLHNKGIVHRDIKAENILLNRHRELKLIDFGFSLVSRPPETIDTFCGTPTYMAPQIVSKRDHVAMYTDMWSMGILMYVMLQGNYPFRAKSENGLFEKIRKGNYEYIHEDISEKSRSLIQQLLRVNPLDRLSSEQLTSPQWMLWYDE